MTRNIPAWAQELLDGAQPGPWVYNRPIVETDGGRGQLTAADPEYGVIDEGDGPLVAAAPDLAETIAAMHYEYVVEARHLATAAPNTWMPCDSIGLTSYDSVLAGEPWTGPRTWRTLKSAKVCAEKAQAYGDRAVQIVRRLVTDVEVVK